MRSVGGNNLCNQRVRLPPHKMKAAFAYLLETNASGRPLCIHPRTPVRRPTPNSHPCLSKMPDHKLSIECNGKHGDWTEHTFSNRCTSNATSPSFSARAIRYAAVSPASPLPITATFTVRAMVPFRLGGPAAAEVSRYLWRGRVEPL